MIYLTYTILSTILIFNACNKSKVVNSAANDGIIFILNKNDSLFAKKWNDAFVQALSRVREHIIKNDSAKNDLIYQINNLIASSQNPYEVSSYIFPLMHSIRKSNKHIFDPNGYNYIITYSSITGISYHYRLDLFIEDNESYINEIYENGEWKTGVKYQLKLQSELINFLNTNQILNESGELSIVTIITNQQIDCYPLFSNTEYFVDRDLFHNNLL
jgi:hypothetical protein